MTWEMLKVMEPFTPDWGVRGTIVDRAGTDLPASAKRSLELFAGGKGGGRCI